MKSESPNSMIAVLASPSPPCARLGVGIRFAGLTDIAEAEVNRYRDVLDCKTSRDGVSVISSAIFPPHSHIYNGAASVNVNPWWIAKVARVQKVSRNSQGHDIWTTDWPLESLGTEVIVGVIGDQVVLCSVRADGDRLLQKRSDPHLYVDGK